MLIVLVLIAKKSASTLDAHFVQFIAQASREHPGYAVLTTISRAAVRSLRCGARMQCQLMGAVLKGGVESTAWTWLVQGTMALISQTGLPRAGRGVYAKSTSTKVMLVVGGAAVVGLAAVIGGAAVVGLAAVIEESARRLAC